MNLSPPGLEKRFVKVSQEEYEHFINDAIRVYTSTAHCGGINLKNRQGKTIAYRNDYKNPNDFWVLKKYWNMKVKNKK